MKKTIIYLVTIILALSIVYGHRQYPNDIVFKVLYYIGKLLFVIAVVTVIIRKIKNRKQTTS
jgi:hypothetical protein